ncbi:hypothetical protein GRS96_12505 [Rathayibacter sp. VKM Ac-2803]|uniref:hypothetical protein n=1 Tax=Rathayibacter sp. VKM Ac-2803 TaxID=2609256 RepID=UPI00135697F3|nr:hypothetical protein [Rathayibacter sp. VKM Ac-2803]MWV50090.1 hypothetical protein [Rathayibacter sp. VKM Ac-2803]
MTVTRFTRHGHPTGYADGCRTNAACPNAGTDQMTCKDAGIRYAGDWAYHRDVDNGTATTDRPSFATEKIIRKHAPKTEPIPTGKLTVAEARAETGVAVESVGVEVYERPRTPKPRPGAKPTAVPPSPEAIAALEQLAEPPAPAADVPVVAESTAPAEPMPEPAPAVVPERPKAPVAALDPTALVLCQCSLCETRFAILATLRRDLARRKTGVCCPRGHWNTFPAEPFATGDVAIEIVFPRRPAS